MAKVPESSTSIFHGSSVATIDSSDGSKPLIEIGLLVAGRLDAIDREVIEVARRRVSEELQHRFPEFAWYLASVARQEIAYAHREGPVALLDHGRMERDVHQWLRNAPNNREPNIAEV